MRGVKKLLAVLGLVTCGACFGQGKIWQERMTIEVPIGERETRSMVRDVAIEELKLRAARKVGTVIEASMSSDGKQITEEIKTVGISLVKVIEVKEVLKVVDRGGMALEVSATLQVDESELDKRASEMRKDSQKIAKIRQLREENDALKRSLTEISASLGKGGSSREAESLFSRHNEVLESLRKNSGIIGSTFVEGAILDMAAVDHQGWLEVKDKLTRGVLDEIPKSLVQAKIESVERVGDKVRAKVTVGWTLNMKKLAEVMKPFVHDTFIWDYYGIEVISIPKIQRGTQYSERAGDFLVSSTVSLELGIGEARIVVPVMFNGGYAWGGKVCSAAARDREEKPGGEKQIACFVSPGKNKGELFGMGLGVTNPLSIWLSEADALKANALKATWVIQYPDGKISRRPAMQVNA